jgi:hypothetical protein
MKLYRIIPLEANVRSTPAINSKNIITTIRQGHAVTGIANSGNWVQITTQVQGNEISGYVHKTLLQQVNEIQSPQTPPIIPQEPPILPSIPEAHLDPGKLAIRRSNSSGRAYPLNESKQPGRNSQDSALNKAEQLGLIIQWLAVDKSARYAPTSTQTYCNIYAHDFCKLAGAYLPRVWWMQKALAQLAQNKHVEVQYGKTVQELNANSLYVWLEEFGADFGWRRTFDMTALQTAANEGQVCIICAQNANLNHSGHIVAVVPETASQTATRQGEKVTKPLQSQAGRGNFQYKAWVWWTDPKRHRNFAFWIHA